MCVCVCACVCVCWDTHGSDSEVPTLAGLLQGGSQADQSLLHVMLGVQLQKEGKGEGREG